MATDYDEKKLDNLLIENTEPNVPAGYWDDLSARILDGADHAAANSERPRPTRIVPHLQWSAAAAALILLCVALGQIASLKSKVSEMEVAAGAAGRNGNEAVGLLFAATAILDAPARQINAAFAIDEFLGGRTMVLASDGIQTALQVDGLWTALRETPVSVRFAVFRTGPQGRTLISSPTIAVLRGNNINIRLRAHNGSISVSYECFDIAETADGLLLPCRISIVSASGYTCQLVARPHLSETTTMIGSVNSDGNVFEVFAKLEGKAGQGRSLSGGSV